MTINAPWSWIPRRSRSPANAVTRLPSLIYQHNLACTLRLVGRVKESAQLMSSLVPEALKMRDPAHLIVLAEDYAAVLAELGDHRRAARLLGASDALRDRLQSPRLAWQQEEIG